MKVYPEFAFFQLRVRRKLKTIVIGISSLTLLCLKKKRIDKKALKLKSLLFSLLCIIYLVTPVGLVGFWEIRYQHLEFNVSCLKVLDKICKLYIQVLFKIKRSASGVDFNLYTSTA